MKYFLKILLILVAININIININAAQFKSEKYPGESKEIVNTIPIKMDTVNKTAIQLMTNPMDSPQLNKIYQKYTDSFNNQETVKFKIGTIFKTKVTCEGIEVDFNDVIPIFVEILQTAIKQIPAYAIKEVTGLDITTPTGFAEFVVDMASGVVCSAYALVVTTSEQVLKTVIDFLDKLFLTNSTEKEKEKSSVQGGAGKATNDFKQTPETNDNAYTRSFYALLESASEEFSSKLNDCMDAMKKMYNEVIKAKIKNFKPFKIKKRKSFCEMAKKYEKEKPSKTATIKSPIKFRKNKKAVHEICMQNTFTIACKKASEKQIQSRVKINEDMLNKIINDKGKLLEVSNEIPLMNLSYNAIYIGKKIMEVFNKCINEPNQTICKRMSCIDTTDTECQATGNNLSVREKAIPFSFVPTPKCKTNDTSTPPKYFKGDKCHDSCPCQAATDLTKVNSKLMKLKQKKLLCIQLEIMNTKERIAFLTETLKITSQNFNREEVINSANQIFEELLLKDYCKYQFNQQIEEFEVFNRMKNKVIEQQFIKTILKNQITMSKLGELKADFELDENKYPGIVDFCTWYEKTGNDDTDFNQETVSALYRDSLTGNYEIRQIQIDTNMKNEIAHTQPLYPVFGVCANSNCSKMKCVYDCRNWTCLNKSSHPLNGTGKLNLDNQNIAESLLKYQATTPPEQAKKNRAIEPDEVRKKKTEIEYIDMQEKQRIAKIQKAYNSYHNYEEKYSRKVIENMLKRQTLEEMLFIY